MRELPPTRQRPHTSAWTAGAETWDTGVRRAPGKEEPVATLDYALLAEYARIDPAGLVTIVGGSFDRVQATSTSGAQQTYVVMRVLLDESEEAVSFEVSVEPPSKAYALQLAGTAERNPAAVPVDGRVGVTLVIGFMVPIVAAGRYVARVSLDGQPVQDLPFVVDIAGHNGL
jgi:hypothetical protein